MNHGSADLFARHGLDSFDAWFGFDAGQVVRQVKQRCTTRFELDGQAFYLKRYWPLPAREYVRAALRLNWPRHGARPEWEAILAFQAAGIPTLTPAAFGEQDGCSFLVTESLEGYRSLRDLQGQPDSPPRSVELLTEVARLCRRMHDFGWAHQDFYTDHLLIPPGAPGPLHVIDLGRVRSASFRWVLKDMAQLNYSFRELPIPERLTLLETYLGRPLRMLDWPWLAVVGIKSWWIARHTRRREL